MLYSWLIVIFTKSVTCYVLHFCHACLNLLLSELAVAQCSSFVKLHDWIPAMYFVVMLECCSMLFLLHLDGYLLLIADRCHICLPFPNRASDSGDLYIDFDRNHLPFPVALLDLQVEDRFNHSFPNHAYASHIASRISCHVHVLVVYYVVCFFPVFALRVGSGNVAFVNDPFDYVRLSSSWTHSSSLRDFRQDDHTLEITSIFAC